MRNKSLVSLTALLLVMAMLFSVGCSSGGSGEKEPGVGPPEKLVIKLGHHHPDGAVVDQLAEKFAELVKDKSDGMIEVQTFPGAQLGQELEAIDGINMGTLQMSIISPGIAGHLNPVMGIETLPFIFDDWDHADRALNGPVGEKVNELLLQTSKMRILGYFHIGFRHMISRTIPIRTATDLDGLKMRSPESWVWTRMFELLGAKPTPVTWGEAYTALQTGVVEGMETPAQGMLDMKFYEVSKYLSLTNHIFGTMTMVINDDFYNKLTLDQQKVITEAGAEAIAWANENVTRPQDEQAIDRIKELGIEVIEIEDITPFREAVYPMYEEFLKKAPDAEELFDIIDDLR